MWPYFRLRRDKCQDCGAFFYTRSPRTVKRCDQCSGRDVQKSENARYYAFDALDRAGLMRLGGDDA